MLKPLRSPRKFPPFLCFDIETRGDKFLVSGLTADGETVEYDTSAEDLVRRLIRKRYRGFVFYAHFGGGFDFRLVIPAVRKVFPSATVKVFQQGKAGRIFMVKVSVGHKLWTFADSFAILPQSLEALCQSFDTRRKKLPSPNFADMVDNEETRKYLAGDCFALFDVLTAYREQESTKRAGHAVTLASSAMANFRTRLTHGIPGLSERDEEFTRNCLFGGRVEVFRKTGIDLSLYDVVSMYPFIMKTRPMPIGSPIHTRTYRQGVIAFYHANIRLRECYIPPIPYIVPNGQKLLFPTGNLRGAFVSSIELDQAERLGLIESLKINEGLEFRDSEIIFADYVEHFFRLKAESEPGTAGYLTSKLMLNALFGKFGQGREKSNLVITSDPKLGMVEVNRTMGLWNEPSTSKAGYIIPSISAWITASARAHLFGFLSESSYYTDTDSVFTDSPMKSGDKLGDMKLEKKLPGETIFLSPKTYANPSKMTHKGIPHKGLDGKPIIDYSAFVAAKGGAKPSFSWETFDGFGESFPSARAKEERWASWDGAFLHKKIRTRALAVRDTKRVWTGDRSRPIILP